MSASPVTIAILAGEPSGDPRGAQLTTAVR
jgi:hypothetical protein